MSIARVLFVAAALMSCASFANPPIVDAALCRDWNEVRRLNDGTNLLAKDEKTGETVFQIATRTGDLGILRDIICVGPDAGPQVGPKPRIDPNSNENISTQLGKLPPFGPELDRAIKENMEEQVMAAKKRDPGGETLVEYRDVRRCYVLCPNFAGGGEYHHLYYSDWLARRFGCSTGNLAPAGSGGIGYAVIGFVAMFSPAGWSMVGGLQPAEKD